MGSAVFNAPWPLCRAPCAALSRPFGETSMASREIPGFADLWARPCDGRFDLAGRPVLQGRMSPTALVRLVAATALLAAGVAGAQVFKWTDANGKTHYGDKPPAEVDSRELAIQVPSYDGPVEVRDWSAILKRKSAATEVAASAGS